MGPERHRAGRQEGDINAARKSNLCFILAEAFEIGLTYSVLEKLVEVEFDVRHRLAGFGRWLSWVHCPADARKLVCVEIAPAS